MEGRAPTVVEIPSASIFSDAIDQYADENKPDPLSLKQLRGLSLEWEDTPLSQQDFSFDPSHALHGVLSIAGEYALVRFRIACAWTFDKSSPKHGNLSYKCCASASTMLPKSDQNSKLDQKIRSKVQQRLTKDAYIRQLLLSDGDEEEWPAFCSAEIRSLPSDLEERVDVSQNIAEAIKRAIWPSAESNLDIVDLVLHFPPLPTSMHEDTISATTELANRAKLRLLEDAMLDACEQEGEDRILEDLSINGENKNKTEQDHKKEQKGRSRSKRSRH